MFMYKQLYLWEINPPQLSWENYNGDSYAVAVGQSIEQVDSQSLTNKACENEVKATQIVDNQLSLFELV